MPLCSISRSGTLQRTSKEYNPGSSNKNFSIGTLMYVGNFECLRQSLDRSQQAFDESQPDLCKYETTKTRGQENQRSQVSVLLNKN